MSEDEDEAHHNRTIALVLNVGLDRHNRIKAVRLKLEEIVYFTFDLSCL